MAKKVKDNVDEIFGQLVKEQNTIFQGAAATGIDMFSEVKMYIPTGSAILDTIISNKEVGGWPCGRIVEVYGEEAIGKSTLAFSAMANTQKLGGIPIYFDVEQAGAPEMMKACGVDMSRLIVSSLTSIEEIFKVMEQNLTTIINNKTYKDKPVFIVLDSLAQMTTDSEIEAGYENNMNIALAKAKQIGKCLRKITPFLRKANACLYVVNQLRDKPGVMFGDPTTTPGGKALKFAASIRIKLMGKKAVVEMDPFVEAEYNKMIADYEKLNEQYKTNGKLGSKPEKPKKPKGEEIIIGYDVTARTDKNKIGPPRREAEFRIIFSQGIIEEEGWLDYCVKYGAVKEIEKDEFKFIDSKLCPDTFEREQWIGILADEDVHTAVRKLLVSKFMRTTVDPALIAQVEIEEEEEAKAAKEELGEEIAEGGN